MERVRTKSCSWRVDYGYYFFVFESVYHMLQGVFGFTANELNVLYVFSKNKKQKQYWNAYSVNLESLLEITNCLTGYWA